MQSLRLVPNRHPVCASPWRSWLSESAGQFRSHLWLCDDRHRSLSRIVDESSRQIFPQLPSGFWLVDLHFVHIRCGNVSRWSHSGPRPPAWTLLCPGESVLHTDRIARLQLLSIRGLPAVPFWFLDLVHLPDPGSDKTVTMSWMIYDGRWERVHRFQLRSMPERIRELLRRIRFFQVRLRLQSLLWCPRGISRLVERCWMRRIPWVPGWSYNLLPAALHQDVEDSFPEAPYQWHSRG